MSDLTIEQVQKILGWSYPTALRFAQENGRIENGGRKWLIPAQSVADVIEADQQRVSDMRQEFDNTAP